MKQLVISKTLMFLFIVVFVMAFSAIFGESNTLIGVTTIVSLLMLLQRNLAVHPWKSFGFLLVLNLSQGLFSYLASQNIFIAIPLNFISLFIVGFFFSFNLRKSLYVGFGLQYLFMLAFPVEANDLPLRLLSLVTGVLLIMVSQIIVNRNKLHKAIEPLLGKMIDDLITGFKNPDAEISSNFFVKEKQLKNMIYDNREHGYHFSKRAHVSLKVSASLENIHTLMNKFRNQEQRNLYSEILTRIKEQLTDSQKKYDLNIHAIQENSIEEYELINSLELLNVYIQQLTHLEKEEESFSADIPTFFKPHLLYYQNLTTNSVRFTYGMRLAIGITLGSFLVDYFQLQDGRWLLFTLFSVIQPYSEDAKTRSFNRLFGTIIGIIIVLALFSIFKSTESRTIIVLLAGYLNGFAQSYRNIIITVTVSAIGSAALLGDANILSVHRIVLVTGGIILAILLNRFVFPYNLAKGTKRIMNMYYENSMFMLKELYEYTISKTNNHTIHNLFTISSLIEERIILNNEQLQEPQYEYELSKQRKINNYIYILYLRIQQNKLNQDELKLILNHLKSMIHTSDDSNVTKEHLLARIEQSSNKELKMCLINILEINDHLQHRLQTK